MEGGGGGGGGDEGARGGCEKPSPAMCAEESLRATRTLFEDGLANVEISVFLLFLSLISFHHHFLSFPIPIPDLLPVSASIKEPETLIAADARCWPSCPWNTCPFSSTKEVCRSRSFYRDLFLINTAAALICVISPSINLLSVTMSVEKATPPLIGYEGFK